MLESFRIFGKVVVNGLGKTKEDLKALQDQTTKTLGASADTLRRTGKNLTDIGSGATTAGMSILKLGAPLVALGAKSLQVSANFEQSMNVVQALTGSTGKEFAALRDLAKEMGVTTEYSASQSADAMTYLAQAGKKPTEIIGMLPTVLQLASAGSIDLAASADKLTNIMDGFGASADQASRYANVLVAVSASANTNVMQLSEAFVNVAPQAAKLGLELEDVSTALGLLGNVGIQGGAAGTGLKNFFTRLVTQTDKLGFSAVDANGKMLPLEQTLGLLHDQGFSVAETFDIFGRQAAITALVLQGTAEPALSSIVDIMDRVDEQGGDAAGTMEAIKTVATELGLSIDDIGSDKGFTKLLDDIAKKGLDADEIIDRFGESIGGGLITAMSSASPKFRALHDEITGTNKAAEIAAKKLEGFKGSMKIMQSAFEGLGIAIGDAGLLEFFTNGVVGATKFISALAKLNPNILKAGMVFTGLLAALGGGLVIFGQIAGAIGTLMTLFGGMAASGAAAGAGAAAAGAGAGAGAAGFGALAASVGAVLLPIAAVVAAVAALYYAYKTNFLGIKDAVATASDWIISKFDALMAWGRSMADGSAKLAQDIGGAWETIKTNISSAITALEPVLGSLKKMASKVMDAVIAILSGDFAGVFEAMNGIAKEGSNALFDVIWAIFNRDWVKIFKDTNKLVDGLLDGLWDVIYKALTDWGPKMYKAGLDINAGLFKGLFGGLNELRKGGIQLVKELKAGFDDEAGIKSPAREFIARGLNIAKAVGTGIKNAAGLPVKEARELVQKLKAGFDDWLSGIGIAVERGLLPLEDVKSSLEKVKAELEAQLAAMAKVGDIDTQGFRDLAADLGKVEQQLDVVNKKLDKAPDTDSYLAKISIQAKRGLRPLKDLKAELEAVAAKLKDKMTAAMGADGKITSQKELDEVTELNTKLGKVEATLQEVNKAIDDTTVKEVTHADKIKLLKAEVDNSKESLNKYHDSLIDIRDALEKELAGKNLSQVATDDDAKAIIKIQDELAGVNAELSTTEKQLSDIAANDLKKALGLDDDFMNRMKVLTAFRTFGIEIDARGLTELQDELAGVAAQMNEIRNDNVDDKQQVAALEILAQKYAAIESQIKATTDANNTAKQAELKNIDDLVAANEAAVQHKIKIGQANQSNLLLVMRDNLKIVKDGYGERSKEAENYNKRIIELEHDIITEQKRLNDLATIEDNNKFDKRIARAETFARRKVELETGTNQELLSIMETNLKAIGDRYGEASDKYKDYAHSVDTLNKQITDNAAAEAAKRVQAEQEHGKKVLAAARDVVAKRLDAVRVFGANLKAARDAQLAYEYETGKRSKEQHIEDLKALQDADLKANKYKTEAYYKYQKEIDAISKEITDAQAERDKELYERKVTTLELEIKADKRALDAMVDNHAISVAQRIEAEGGILEKQRALIELELAAEVKANGDKSTAALELKDDLAAIDAEITANEAAGVQARKELNIGYYSDIDAMAEGHALAAEAERNDRLDKMAAWLGQSIEDQKAHDAELETLADNRYQYQVRTGELTLEDQRTKLEQLLIVEKNTTGEYSKEWLALALQLYDINKKITADEQKELDKQAAARAKSLQDTQNVAREMAANQIKLARESGALSNAEYKKHLETKLADLENNGKKFTNEWMQINGEITKLHIDMVGSTRAELEKLDAKYTDTASNLSSKMSMALGIASNSLTGFWKTATKAASGIAGGFANIIKSGASTKDIVGGLTMAFGALNGVMKQQNSEGNQMVKGLFAIGGAIAEVATGIPGLGAAIGAIGSVVSNALGNMANGAAEVKRQVEKAQASIALIDLNEIFVKKRVSRGGILGWFGSTMEVIDKGASKLGLAVAKALDSAVMGGLKSAAQKYLSGGSRADFVKALKSSVRKGIEDSVIQAVINGAIVKGALGKMLTDLTKAIASKDQASAKKIIADIGKQIPAITDTVTGALDGWKKGINDGLGELKDNTKKATEPLIGIFDNQFIPKVKQASGSIAGIFGNFSTEMMQSVDPVLARLEDVGKTIAKSLRDGFGSGLRSAARDYLSGATDQAGMLKALRGSIQNTIIDAVVDAFMQSALIKGALGDMLDKLGDAFAKGDKSAVAKLMGDIGRAIPKLAQDMATALDPLKESLKGLKPPDTTPAPTPKAKQPDSAPDTSGYVSDKYGKDQAALKKQELEITNKLVEATRAGDAEKVAAYQKQIDKLKEMQAQLLRTMEIEKQRQELANKQPVNKYDGPMMAAAGAVKKGAALEKASSQTATAGFGDTLLNDIAQPINQTINKQADNIYTFTGDTNITLHVQEVADISDEVMDKINKDLAEKIHNARIGLTGG